MDNPNRDKLLPREADGSLYPWWCYALLYGCVFHIAAWLLSIIGPVVS